MDTAKKTKPTQIFKNKTTQRVPPKEFEHRFIRVPSNRRAPLKRDWGELVAPITEHMKLQIRMNLGKGQIELRTTAETASEDALQKSADFVEAFVKGFAAKDALAILRMSDVYVDSFHVTDVRKLERGHLPRAIGRIVGRRGKTKNAIENATATRVVVADTHVHVLGTYGNIRVARAALVRLIVGAQPGKVYSQMQVVSARNKSRF